ncbi:MAG: ribonuclease III domain-containing protein [Ruminococcus sp.]|nr:ribonuclease III domain-containing protein [Ruminococcus sp.]
MDKRDAMQYSPLTLAFLGDSVYEQLVRKKLVLSANRPVNVLHKLTIQRVCAEYQADAVKLLLEKDILTVDEQNLLKRGRNASGVSAPKHSTVAQYRSATGLECLLGYLFLTGQTERIEEIFNLIWESDIPVK